jgi:hypothetical protein
VSDGETLSFDSHLGQDLGQYLEAERSKLYSN